MGSEDPNHFGVEVSLQKELILLKACVNKWRKSEKIFSKVSIQEIGRMKIIQEEDCLTGYVTHTTFAFSYCEFISDKYFILSSSQPVENLIFVLKCYTDPIWFAAYMNGLAIFPFLS